MSFLPGHFPAGAAAAGKAYAPASIIFNGTDEWLGRTLSTTSPNTTVFTWSAWLKIIAYDSAQCQIFQVENAPTNSQFLFCGITTSGDAFSIGQDAGTVDWTQIANPLTPDITTGTWEHWVIRFDSTLATADDRIRFYRNGSLVADIDSTGGSPALNEQHRMFMNTWQHQIGGLVDLSQFGNFKLAFLDVLEGVSQDASAFAFSNGGTWTRKRYTGSRGTYGFSLDGTDGFNDVSGNGQHFTGTNMTTSANLDFVDLPPYTN